MAVVEPVELEVSHLEALAAFRDHDTDDGAGERRVELEPDRGTLLGRLDLCGVSFALASIYKCR